MDAPTEPAAQDNARWHIDDDGQLVFADGTTYAPTARGWILAKHPTRHMIELGTFAPDPMTTAAPPRKQ